MIATNKETGQDITGYVIKYLEKKITKEEFERATGLTKEDDPDFDRDREEEDLADWEDDSNEM